MKNPHAVALGRLGGQQTSERKKRSSAENGKKGGRRRFDQILCECGHTRNLHPNAGPCMAYAASPRECCCEQFAKSLKSCRPRRKGCRIVQTLSVPARRDG
jgi:hypothetical protein